MVFSLHIVINELKCEDLTNVALNVLCELFPNYTIATNVKTSVRPGNLQLIANRLLNNGASIAAGNGSLLTLGDRLNITCTGNIGSDGNTPLQWARRNIGSQLTYQVLRALLYLKFLLFPV